MANSRKKCKHCKEYVTAETGAKVPAGFFCCMDHAIEFARSKQKAEKNKLQRKEYREAKERLKTLSDHLREAQQAFNAYIRERDKNEPCISCSRFHQGQYHAGHYLSVGARPNLRFDEKNVHKQCQPCNTHLSGNLVNYRIGLIKKIGHQAVESLESDREPRRYRIEDAKRIKADYRERFRELKKGH